MNLIDMNHLLVFQNRLKLTRIRSPWQTSFSLRSGKEEFCRGVRAWDTQPSQLKYREME
jgi:hypothetical protein